MKFLKKTLNFFKNGGLSLFFFTLLFILSIILVSITQKGSVYYGNRCVTSINEDIISYIKQDEIISYDYELNCNTLFIDLTVKENTTKEMAKTLLVRLSSYCKDTNYNINTHLTVKGLDYIIFATLIDNEITMNITNV